MTTPEGGLEAIGLEVAQARYNASAPALFEAAVAKGEGMVSADGAFVAHTGEFTGRSPRDKHIVRRPSSQDDIWWEGNNAMTPEAFDHLRADMFAYLREQSVEVQDLICGAHPDHAVGIRLVAELSWHALFLNHLLIVPDEREREAQRPGFTIVNAPGFSAEPGRHGCRSETVVALDFETRMVLIGGTEYAGENKKAAFTILNHLCPERGVLPMHCSANHATDDPDDVAIFFGLSGTGKTTLSADPSRTLIGDDEHGWSDEGVFNFEGGCYAKTIALKQAEEPEIWSAVHRFSTVLENVVVDLASRRLDLDDAGLTENTRAAYPLAAVGNASPTGRAGTPRHVFLLTCDAYGVTPPLMRLPVERARQLFLLGFTSKVAGTERGVTGPTPTFSTCFGAPFLTRSPRVYADLFAQRLRSSGAQCWLLNTGWTGGDAETGRRMPIAATRALLSAVLQGGLNGASHTTDPVWGLGVPADVPDEARRFRDPQSTWADPSAFDRSASRLRHLIDAEFARLGLPALEAQEGADV